MALTPPAGSLVELIGRTERYSNGFAKIGNVEFVRGE